MKKKIESIIPVFTVSCHSVASATSAGIQLACKGKYDFKSTRLPRLQYVSARNDMKRKAAFTLAEVLTTLMVIGVVAALTIPTLQQGIGDAILNRQKKVFANKLEEGLYRMAVQDKLGTKYKNTNAFIKEFKNFFSVTMTCDSNNLKNCFNETITNSDGDVFEVENLKSAKDFNSENNDANVYGIKFTDGTSMLLAYEPSCRGYSSSDIPKDANVGAFAKCFKYIYDVNGTKEENKVGIDMIGTLAPTKSKMFGLSFEIIDNKMYYPNESDGEGHTYTCVNGNTDTENPSNLTCDYWTGAKVFCQAKGGRAASMEDLAKIASKIYGIEVSTWGGGSIGSGASLGDPTLASTLGLAQSSIHVWSSTPCQSSGSDNAQYASYRIFTTNDTSSPTESGDYCAGRNASCPVICVK